MKIAQIIPSLLPTGPVNVALDLATLFSQAGHSVSIFYFDKKPGAVSHPKAKKIGFSTKLNWKNFDVVHSHGLRPDAYVWRNIKQMPATVCTLHNYLKNDLRYSYGPLAAKIFSPFWNLMCSKHKANIVLSQNMLAYYQAFWRNKKLVCIANTRVIDLERDLAREEKVKELAAGKKIIGSISNVTGIKGLEQLVHFVAKNPQWAYVHVGGGELGDLKELAAKLKVSERCFLLGKQPKGWQYARAFTVFALPSRSEGFPLSLIEAVQLQVPVITSSIPIFKELFPAKAVARFELDNPESLLAAINQTLLNPQERSALALRHFQENYHPKKVYQKHLELYQSIV
jgi:glycosyltransferase involved in cell wall biosynthesis